MKYKKIIKKWQKWCKAEERYSDYEHTSGIEASRRHLKYLLKKHRPKTTDKTKTTTINTFTATLPDTIDGILYIYSGNPFYTYELLAKVPVNCELTDTGAKLIETATTVIMHSGTAEWFKIEIGGVRTSGPIGDLKNPITSGINIASKYLYDGADLNIKTLKMTFYFNKPS